MDKRRTIKYYGFIEWMGHLEDYYFHSFSEAVSFIKTRLLHHSAIHGVIITESKLLSDEFTWVVSQNQEPKTLRFIKDNHGSLNDYIQCLSNQGVAYSEVDWVKEGF